MDSNEIERLRQIAIDAQINHWPPHLGLNTDAEKVGFLAQSLEKAIDEQEDTDDLRESVDTLEKERDGLIEDKTELEDQVRTLTSRLKEAEGKLTKIQELL